MFERRRRKEKKKEEKERQKHKQTHSLDSRGCVPPFSLFFSLPQKKEERQAFPFFFLSSCGGNSLKTVSFLREKEKKRGTRQNERKEEEEEEQQQGREGLSSPSSSLSTSSVTSFRFFLLSFLPFVFSFSNPQLCPRRLLLLSPLWKIIIIIRKPARKRRQTQTEGV